MGTSRTQDKIGRAVQAGIDRDYRTASRLLEETLSETDAPPDALLLLGRSYHAQGAYPRALACFRDYLQKRPRSSAGYFFAGRTYLALGFAHKAVPMLKKAHTIRPQDAHIQALLGAAYLKSRRSREAVLHLQAAVEALPENRRVYRAYLNALLIRGIRLCRSDDQALGAQMLRFVVDNGLDAPLPRLELGRAYREAGRLEEALEHYNRAIALAPEDMELRWYRVSMLMVLDRGAEAMREVHAIRSSGSRVPDIEWSADLVDRYMIAAFLETSAWRRAAEACRAWLKTRKPDPMIHTMFAEALRNQGELDSARNHLERAANLDPGQAEIRYAQVLIDWQLEDWKALRKHLDILERLGGDRTLLDRFEALWSARTEEDPKKSIALLQKAIHTSGPVPELMHALGEAYLRIGLFDLAEGWFEKTIMIEPGNERAQLGSIAAAEGQIEPGTPYPLEKMKGAYLRYLERWGDNRAIRRDYAQLLIQNGDHGSAVEQLEQLLSWEPSNTTLRRVLAYSYRKTGRYREAAVLLKSILKEKPKDLALLMEFIRCMEKAGANRHAQLVLEKALGLFPASIEPALALGILRYKDKKKESALDAFRAAMEIDPKDPRPYSYTALIYRKSGIAETADRYEAEARRRESAGRGRSKRPSK